MPCDRYLAGNKHPVQVPFRRFLHRKRAEVVCRVASSAWTGPPQTAPIFIRPLVRWI